MNTQQPTLKTIPFDIVIPNLNGDGIANTVRIDVQTYTDPATGEDILTPESIDLIEKTQARHMGLITSDDLRDLRERLRLTQEEMSELLQIGAKTYTRWESGGARPSRSMNVLLRAIDDGQIDVTYLRALRDPVSHREWQNKTHIRHWFLSCAEQWKQPHEEQMTLLKSVISHRPAHSLLMWEQMRGYLEASILDADDAITAMNASYSIIGPGASSPWSNFGAGKTRNNNSMRIPNSAEQRANYMNSRADAASNDLQRNA